MKKLVYLLFLILSFYKTEAQTYFPPLSGNTWDTVAPASLGWCLDSLNSVYNYLGQKNTKAFIVLKDGKIALEKYYGTFTKDSVWYWASAGKTLIGFSTGIAQEQGYLKISDTTSKYLGNGWTSLSPAQEKAITIRHQLTMTTGLDDGVSNSDCTDPACLQYKAAPGTRWAYHNAPFTLMHKVLDNTTGNFNLFFNTKLRNKIGMGGIWLKGAGSDTFNIVYYSTPRGMARFGLLLLNKGIWNTDTLLHDTAYFRQMTTTSQSLNLSYGYLTWLNGKSSYMIPQSQLVFPTALAPNAPADMFCALGKNDQKIYVIPSTNMVVIRMGNDAGFPALAVSAFDNELWGKLKDIFCTPTSSIRTINNSNISLYPNPANDIININAPDNYTASLHNITGQILATYNITKGINKINTLQLQAGSYYITFINEKENKTIRFIKE